MEKVASSPPVPTVASSLLRLARVRLQLTQRQLAEKSGVPQSTIARIECGRIDPGFESVLRILATVGLEPRIHLEVLDTHDLVLAQRHQNRSDEKREQMESRHQDNLKMFRNARVVKLESDSSKLMQSFQFSTRTKLNTL
jgi:predicted transcriptional regulator